MVIAQRRWEYILFWRNSCYHLISVQNVTINNRTHTKYSPVWTTLEKTLYRTEGGGTTNRTQYGQNNISFQRQEDKLSRRRTTTYGELNSFMKTYLHSSCLLAQDLGSRGRHKITIILIVITIIIIIIIPAFYCWHQKHGSPSRHPVHTKGTTMLHQCTSLAIGGKSQARSRGLMR